MNVHTDAEMISKLSVQAQYRSGEQWEPHTCTHLEQIFLTCRCEFRDKAIIICGDSHRLELCMYVIFLALKLQWGQV